MWLKKIHRILIMTAITEKRIKAQNPKKLEEAKMYFMERMEAPFGWHTMGAPLAFSTVFNVISCAALISLWKPIFDFFGLSMRAGAITSVAGGLIYCLLITSPIMLIARGYQLALKFYLIVIFLTLILLTGDLVYVLIDGLFFSGNKQYIITALSGILPSLISIRLINSAMFCKTVSYYLHNRIWRWQLKYVQQQVSETIIKK